MRASNRAGLALWARRRGSVALSGALAIAGLTGGTALAAEDLEPAYVERASGSDAVPKSRGGVVHVRLIGREQDLLRAALKAGPAARLHPVSRAAHGALGIVRSERSAALGAERSYEAGIRDLADEAEATVAGLKPIAAAIRAHGGIVEEIELAPAAVRATVPSRLLPALSGSPAVALVQGLPRPRGLSGAGTTVVGAPSWWADGFTGGTGSSDTVPADAAIESEAADPTHPAFSATIVDNDPSQGVTDHGTHTGGIIASGDGTYPGVAPGIDRLIGSGNELYALGLPIGSGADDPAETLNISFGSTASSESEDNPADILTAVFGVGQAFAAGNENVDGTPTVGNIGRNVLTVGGFNDLGTIDPTDDVVLGVSSRGPTPGGRKKPDLTAPAGAVIAPSAAWNSPPSNPDFTAMSGTSFAAPHVAGAMTLLEGAGIASAMAQRAILINSARDWVGAATGLIGWSSPQSGWRPEVGWGQLDLGTALAERSNYRLGEVAEGEAAYYSATVPGGGKATLAYELRGYFVGFPNPGTQTLTYTQSNLDLHQYLADGTEIPPAPALPHGGGPDALDPDDTVEQVRAPAGGPHQIVFKIEAASEVEGADAEPFALTSVAPLTPLQPPEVVPVNVSSDPAGSVGCGAPVEIAASLSNESTDLGAGGVSVRLEPGPGVEIVAGDPEQVASGGDLGAGETSEPHHWTVAATANGAHELTIVGVGGSYGTEFTRTASVDLTADCVAPGTSIDDGPAGAIRDRSPEFRFSGTGGAVGFECAVDASAFEPCGSPLRLGGLGEGGHEFAVRAVDAVGNADPSPATRSFVVDRSVAGARLSIRSARISRRGRAVGSVETALGEGGIVRIGAKAWVRKRRIAVRSAGYEFGGGGRGWARLVVAPQDRSRVRSARRHGRKAVVRVSATFEDELGNARSKRIGFAAR
ncbi:MAG: S8 family serine peptidase [Solirubrobacterales bacterium]